MVGAIQAAAKSAGVDDPELLERVRSEAWDEVVRAIADRLHESVMDADVAD